MLKKAAVFLLLLPALIFQARANHLMGGEITWDCLGSGQYVFNLKVYLDCSSNIPAPSSANIRVFNHPSITQITCTFVSKTDISPVCNAAGPAITCTGQQPGSVEEYLYQSAPLNLPGVPPAQGWTFTYDNFARNNSIINLQNPASYGFTLRAVMYSYNGQNADPCFDSSPKFLESPKTIICAGQQFTFNHNAIDNDLDSLSFSWAQPLDKFTAAAPTSFNPGVDPVILPFTNGYSYTNPLPGPAFDPQNKPAVLNALTGEVSLTSFTSGNFVTVIKAESWKCGIKVAEIYREIQVVLLPCGNNNPPNVSYTNFSATVTAGTTVTFTLSGTDAELLPNGNPQTITLDASGNQFGAGFSNPNAGCLNPPCATLNPPPPVSSQNSVQTTFNWQTDCDHVNTNSCNSKSNNYTFVVRTQDDFCPIPSVKITTISVTVLAQATIPSPDLKCAAVALNGDVTVTWIPVANNGTFDSYHLYYSATAAGPYNLIYTTNNIAVNNYTHVGANAQNQIGYYYVQTRSGCNGQVYSPAADTIKTMLLNVSNPGTGVAILSWNAIHTPLFTTSTGVYEIFKEYPAGTWTQIGTTSSLVYRDTITVCQATINYRIEMDDASGCTSVSSVDGGLFQDKTAPDVPVLDSVSVTVAGTVQLGWEPSKAGDTRGYVIYQLVGGLWQQIATTIGMNITSYINLLSNASTASEDYRIAATDSCGNTSPLGTQHRTLFITYKLDPCELSATISWNGYINMPQNVAGYKIYRSDNGGAYTLVGQVSASNNSYVNTGLVALSNYCYIVAAYNTTGNISSSSNQICFQSTVPSQPTFNYLRTATVSGTDISVSAYVDNTAVVQRYEIERSDNLAGVYQTVGVMYQTGASTLYFTDLTAEPDQQSYYYRVVAYDSCGFRSLVTNLGRTIFLTATPDEAGETNTLAWNDYELWGGNVMSYNIYRGVDGSYSSTPIANVPYAATGSNIYADDISAISKADGQFSYYIEALEGAGNPYSITETSISNIASALQTPKFYIPNAFIPTAYSNNQVFKPVFTFVSDDEYEFRIYDRWGQEVFRTTDVNEGWNGTVKGERVGSGAFIYYIKFKASNGEYIEKKGGVTLIR